jgi:hypothetical protein
VPLEALILAFAHSRAKALVGTDALRSVLSGQYRELHKGNRFDLEPVWDLLAEQPGFDPAEVGPPLCRFKSWEGQLGLAIGMPAAMATLDDSDRAELASQVTVPAAQLAEVLRGELVASEVPEAAAPDPAPESRPSPPRSAASRPERPDRAERNERPERAERAERAERPERPERYDAPIQVPATAKMPRLRRLTQAQRRVLEIAAIILAVGGFAVAGVQLQRGCHRPTWDQVPTRFAGDIPLAAAERQGPEVSGSLRDGRWLSLPAPARSAQMRSALEALPRDVQVFFVRDVEGQVRAIARWFGQPRQISVTLQ